MCDRWIFLIKTTQVSVKIYLEIKFSFVCLRGHSVCIGCPLFLFQIINAKYKIVIFADDFL